MKIIASQPPNIDAIRKVFTFTQRVIFAYGDSIYNPDNVRLDSAMIVHEEVHEKQQAEIGVEEWWTMYLQDSNFRAEQEKPAYRAQYREGKKFIFNQERKNKYAMRLAEALASDTYGYCISLGDAFKYITS